METFAACGRLGAVVFAANPRLRAAEMAEIFVRLRPRALIRRSVHGDLSFAELVEAAATSAGGRPPIEIVCNPSGREPGGIVTPDRLIAEGTSCEIPETRPAEASPLAMFATSGTTSAPKYVVHSHRSVVVHAADVARRFDMSAEDAVMLQLLPCCGVFGFCQAMAALAAGRPTILLPTFTPDAAVEAIRSHSVTHFNAADETIATLADAASPGDLATLRLVGAASFNQGPEMLARLAETHRLPLVGLYGMSEVQALFAARGLQDPASSRFAPGGRPVSRSAGIRIRDPDTGKLAETGEAGEIEIRGPSLFSEYRDDVSATGAAMSSDGFVRTGDLGRLDGDGGFTFLARMGDALRLGGFLVHPAEIAGFICSIPGVTDCQVVGVRAGGRMRAVAFVIPASPGAFAPDAIVAECCMKLAPYKVPVLVHALEEFPAVESPNGVKVRRAELRRLAEDILAT